MERPLTKEQAGELLAHLNVGKSEDVAQRLVGLADDMDGISLEAVAAMPKSIIQQIYRSANDYRISDDLQTAIGAIREESNVFTSDLIPTFAQYLDNVHLDKPLVDNNYKVGALKRNPKFQDLGEIEIEIYADLDMVGPEDFNNIAMDDFIDALNSLEDPGLTQ